MSVAERYHVDDFFDVMERERLTLVYDNVRIRGGHCKAVPIDFSLKTKFSRNVGLKIPMVSSPMDTVTEYKMAIAMAIHGGIGVIHKNMTAEEQARQAARVKFHVNCLIETPICVFGDETIKSILSRIRAKGWTFHSFPVLDRDGKLIGVITKSDFEFCFDQSLTASKVMTASPISAPSGTSFDEAFGIMVRNKKKFLPIINPSGNVCGLYVFSDLLRIKNGNASMYNLDERNQLRVAAAIGSQKEDYERVERLVEEHVDAIVIDSSQGDSVFVWDMLEWIKKHYPELDVMAGNISTPDAAKELIRLGVDAIRVGQGPGSICITTPTTGGGAAQLSAVYRCSKAARGSGVPICADGGIRYAGDIAKAIVAGADNAMIGGIFARAEESPGEVVLIQGQKKKRYRGMGSIEAMRSSLASRERYSQEKFSNDELVPEGVPGLVPYAGDLRHIIHVLKIGILTSMKNSGVNNIPEMQKSCDFDRVTSEAIQEGNPHDIIITEEPANYEINGQ